MLVVKKMGVCVTHISRSVIARLMMNMLAGVRRLRLLTHRVEQGEVKEFNLHTSLMISYM